MVSHNTKAIFCVWGIYVESRERPVRIKRTIDFEQLVSQFSKMYKRDMSTEEECISLI